MASTPRRDRSWLLAIAREVAGILKRGSLGTRLRIRSPRAATATNTSGWYAVVGDLGKGQPRLEVWFDRFSGYPERKLYVCVRSELRPPILSISKRATPRLGKPRVVTLHETKDDGFLVLAERLARFEFGRPVLEKYPGGRTFYGMYDSTRTTQEPFNPRFCRWAANFFGDVASTLPGAIADDEQRDVYPRFENRKLVASHLRRERSRMLAAACKERDGYQCQVCNFQFVDGYGRLGADFAEAHHRIPLGQLPKNVQTNLEDLVTVCSNCHRMLHRMAGRRDDLGRLKTIVRNRRR